MNFGWAVVLALLILSGGKAHAALLGNGFDGQLYDIDPATGAATNPRSTGIDPLAGIAFGPDGTLYGLTTFEAVPASNALFRIDPATGASTLVGTTGLNDIFEGDLAFDPTTGVLYAIEDVPIVGRHLFTIDTTTGAATDIGVVTGTGTDLSGLAFDTAGNLYVLDTGADAILQVNKATGAILSSINLNVALGSVAGLAFDPRSNTLYVADGGTNTPGTDALYTLNPTTGVLTLVGPTGLADGLAGLAVSVPGPTSLALFNLGLAALGVARRQRRQAP